MAHVEIVRHDLGEAGRIIGGCVGRRLGKTYLIVDHSATLRDIVELAGELLTCDEMTSLRNRRASDLAWTTQAA
jgi:hypothetical protein